MKKKNIVVILCIIIVVLISILISFKVVTAVKKSRVEDIKKENIVEQPTEEVVKQELITEDGEFVEDEPDKEGVVRYYKDGEFYRYKQNYTGDRKHDAVEDVTALFVGFKGDLDTSNAEVKITEQDNLVVKVDDIYVYFNDADYISYYTKEGSTFTDEELSYLDPQQRGIVEETSEGIYTWKVVSNEE